MFLKKQNKYYSLDNILSYNAQYNIIFGERSNGKTYAALEYGLKQYQDSKKSFAIVRRYAEDFRGKRGATMFDALEANGLISKYTSGLYNRVVYYSSRWYFAKFDEELNKEVRCEEPFAYAFAIAQMEHDKSTSYPTIGTIIFDEFITRSIYLNDEFVLFMNLVSTIVRQRDDVKIFMLGNTVNQYCPYFKEMGLNHITKMEKGKIDVYTYGDSDLKVAVEYSDNPVKSKPSDVYFAFDNPKLNMITGGAWELAIYPHCPVKFNKDDIQFIYFINFDDALLQCEVVLKDELFFTFIHRKTTPIQDDNNDLIYTTEYSSKPNYRRKITLPTNEYERKLMLFFVDDKVFYQDNEVGEVVRNYINWCKTTRTE